MKIAVLGGGFCGLAVAWNFLQTHSVTVDIFDPVKVGSGTSGIASGLMHYYAGAHAKLNWKGQQGFACTKKLLEVATKTLNEPVAEFSGLLRVAVNEQQRADYSTCASKDTCVRWFEKEECAQWVPEIVPFPGIFIQEAAVVDCKLYLTGLWKACELLGARWIHESVHDVEELSGYDTIVVTVGAHTHELKDTQHLPIVLVKGQVLEYERPVGQRALPFPINSQVYLCSLKGTSSCLLGATYERDFTGLTPDISRAKEELLPKLKAFYPDIAQFRLQNCRAGVRASTPDHLPLMTRLNKKTWSLTGMGSKGLLYHALYAEELVSRFCKIT